MALPKIMYKKTRPGQIAFLGVHPLITTQHTTQISLQDMSEDRIFQTVFCFGIEQIHNALVSSEGNTTGCWDHNALISNPLMRDPGLGWHQLADALGRHLTQTGLNRYS